MKKANMILNARRINAVAVYTLGKLDLVKTSELDNYSRLKDGKILPCVAAISVRVELDSVAVRFDVYADHTFQVQSAGCAFGLDGLEAYGRALDFIKALELTDFTP